MKNVLLYWTIVLSLLRCHRAIAEEKPSIYDPRNWESAVMAGLTWLVRHQEPNGA